MECATCTMQVPLIPCPNANCSYKMCSPCVEKWYKDHTLCPACRLPNGLTPTHLTYVKQSHSSCRICIHVIVGYCLTIVTILCLGRLLTYFTNQHTSLLCNGNLMMCLQLSLTGSIFILGTCIIFLLLLAGCFPMSHHTPMRVPIGMCRSEMSGGISESG